MIIYPDTEKELFFSDYKAIPDPKTLNCTEIIETLENLYKAMENAFIYHSDLLSAAIADDIITVQKTRIELYLKTVSSGHIASVINNCKYSETDKAIAEAFNNLNDENFDESMLLLMGTDPGMIDDYIRKCYEQRGKA